MASRPKKRSGPQPADALASADMPSLDRLKKRRDAADTERRQFQPLLDEAYDYAIPYRRGTQDRSKGEKRVDKVFDHTAIVSAMRFAGKLQQDLVPTGQEWSKLEPGALTTNLASKEKEALTSALDRISRVTGAFFLDGEWDTAFHELALDLSAGTAAMLILEGEDQRLARFVTVPLDEIKLEGGPYGKITGIFWTKKWTWRAIVENWPKWQPPPAVENIIRDKPEDEVDVFQDTVWDPKRKRWVLTAWIEKDQITLEETTFRTCPWLTPRYFRVSGETYGRGPVMLAMPTIKTLNMAQKFTLQAAAIAMMGIFTAIDDGVFNPDLSPIEPGAVWKVARNGGVMGPSVARFPDPRIDLSNIVVNDLRLGVQSTMMDQSLPADGAAVRSATEILERVKRLAADHLGAFGRLVAEIIEPVIRRVIEIAYKKKLIQDAPPIDQLLVRLRVTSPLAIAREMQRIQMIIQWLTMCQALLGDKLGRVAKVDKILMDAGRAMGVGQDDMTTQDERDAMDQQDQAMQAAQLAMMASQAAGAGVGGGQPPAGPDAPAAAEPAPEMTA